MAHEFTKEELRRPDEFVNFFESKITQINHHRKQVLISLALVLLVAAGVVGWEAFQDSKDKTASIDFALLMDKYPSELTASEDGWKNFSTQVDTFMQKHAKTSFAGSAYLYKAKAQFNQKQFEDALKSFQQASKKLAEPYVYLAQEGEAVTQMQLEHWDQAQTILKFLSEKQNNPLRDYHLYNLALVQEQLGSKDLAMQSYEKIIKDFPQSAMVEKAKAKVGDVKIQ